MELTRCRPKLFGRRDWHFLQSAGRHCPVNVFLARFCNTLTNITSKVGSGLDEFYGRGDFQHHRRTDEGGSPICRVAA
jgi:hypothetical protein